MEQRTKQGTVELIRGRLNEGPSNQGTHKSIDHLKDGTTNVRPTNILNGELTDKSKDRPTDKQAEGPTDQPTNGPTDQGTGDWKANQPTEGSVYQPRDQPTNGPTA